MEECKEQQDGKRGTQVKLHLIYGEVDPTSLFPQAGVEEPPMPCVAVGSGLSLRCC